MSVASPGSYNSANVGSHYHSYSFLPNVILHTVFRDYLQIEQWLPCSSVCRNWNVRLEDERCLKKIFSKDIAEKYIFSNLWGPKLLPSLRDCSKVNVKIYLDISSSMVNLHPQDDPNNTPFNTANAAIHDIASNCFRYIRTLELCLFSDQVHQEYPLENQTELDKTLNSLHCDRTNTSYDFLEPILREQTDELRKIYLISDMEITPDSSRTFIRKIKAITNVANLQLELINVNVTSEDETEFITMLNQEKDQGHLPYIACRKFELTPNLTEQDSSSDEAMPSATKKQKNSQEA